MPPRAPATRQDGLLRRDFANGYVLLNQPGNPTRKVATIGGRGPDGAPRNTVTLRGGQGAVMIGILPPVPVLAKPVTNPVSAVIAKVIGQGRKRRPQALDQGQGPQDRPPLGAGQGQGPKGKGRSAKVRIQVRRKVGKRWVGVRTATVKVNRKGRFSKLFTGLKKGRYTAKASGVGRGAAKAKVSARGFAIAR